MFLRHLLARLLLGLVPLAILSSVYLYLYPVFRGCAHPLPLDAETHGPLWGRAFLNTLRQHVLPESVQDEPAVFRLLVLADPQLEGDSSLPTPEWELGARIRQHWNDTLTSIAEAPFPLHPDVFCTIFRRLLDLFGGDIPRSLDAARKRVDLLGNDYYLAHIYRTLHWWTRPSHVTVLGDLIGSQWVTDEEFDRRGHRFWDRVFRNGQRVSDEIVRTGENAFNMPISYTVDEKMQLEELDASTWANRIINIVGNHDIGYSGDASESRLERFERVFGRANWDVRFRYPPSKNQSNGTDDLIPTLHLINMNSLTLDSPPYSTDIQWAGYTYMNNLIAQRTYPVEDRTTFTLLLTHLPLHKRDGVCTDGPYFTFFDEDDDQEELRFRAGGLREQNHLSEHVSTSGVLQGIFGMSGEGKGPGGGWGRNGLILTGHDHTGCDVVHYVDRSPPPPPPSPVSDDESTDEGPKEQRKSWIWNARRYNAASEPHEPDTPSIREVTLRSMMGEFGGNAGLLSLWFDFDAVQWKYAITMCPAGVQHIWWAVHVINLVALVALVLYIVLSMVDLAFGKTTVKRGAFEKTKKTQ